MLHWAGIDECIADLHSTFPRHFAIVDGVVGMEGNGPIQGNPKPVGVLVAGRDMTAVDATCCRIMKINPSAIRYLRLAAGPNHLDEDNIRQIGEHDHERADSVRADPAVPHHSLMSRPTAEAVQEDTSSLTRAQNWRDSLRRSSVARTPVRVSSDFRPGAGTVLLASAYSKPGDLSSHLYNAWLSILIGEGKAPGLKILGSSLPMFCSI